jgi:hypothetical protein
LGYALHPDRMWTDDALPRTTSEKLDITIGIIGIVAECH